MASSVKLMHFNAALNLTREYFNRANVIDFGCCDGPFLPSLSRYFPYVVGIDIIPEFIDIASRLRDQMHLDNVRVICNDSLSLDDLKSQLSGMQYQILFLLETMEHVGREEDMYGSKMDFLQEVASLIQDDGIIVISVPKMVGPSFLIQRLGLWALGMYREPISVIDLLRASFLYDTKNLEKGWTREHLGFNHRLLEKIIDKQFKILKKKSGLFQMLYMITKRHERIQQTVESTIQGADVC